MFDRLRPFLLLAMILGVASPVPAASQIHRIVAVGDLHGDFSAWRDIALAAGLVDAHGRWAGGKTVLVQTGDVVDRGPNSLKIVQDLMRLQREAPRAGGKVVTLVGNHEAMNVTDDLRYVSKGDFAAFTTPGSAALRERAYAANKTLIEAAYRKTDAAMSGEAISAAWIAATPLGQVEHQSAWHPGGTIGRWVVANPAVVLLDDTLFVHGGISAAYSKRPIADINAAVAAALAAKDTAPGAIINDAAGPLWYRGLIARTAAEDAVVPPLPSIDDELTTVLAAYGAKCIVVGHTPILAGIAVVHEGRLIRIDTGISEAYGGKPSYLEILDGAVIPHLVERSAPLPAGAK